MYDKETKININKQIIHNYIHMYIYFFFKYFFVTRNRVVKDHNIEQRT